MCRDSNNFTFFSNYGLQLLANVNLNTSVCVTFNAHFKCSLFIYYASGLLQFKSVLIYRKRYRYHSSTLTWIISIVFYRNFECEKNAIMCICFYYSMLKLHYTANLLFHQSPRCTVTTWWLDTDSLVTVGNCRQHGDWAANGSVVTVLPGVKNSDYTVTVQSPCSHSAA